MSRVLIFASIEAGEVGLGMIRVTSPLGAVTLAIDLMLAEQSATCSSKN